MHQDDGNNSFEVARWRHCTPSESDHDNEKNGYLEATKISYKSLLVIGFMPFTFKKKGRTERVSWKFYSLESFYFIATLSTALSIAIFTMLNNIARIQKAKKLNDLFRAFFNTFTVAPLITKLTSFPLEMERTEKFIRDWHKLQTKYRKVTGKNFYSMLSRLKKKIYITYFICTICPLALMSELRFYNVITWKNMLEQITYTYNALCAWQLAAFWFVNISCIRQILKDLKLQINKRLLGDCYWTTAKSTDDLRFLWLSLSNIIQQLGTMFVFTLVTRIFVMSTIFIISLYFALAPSTFVEHRSYDELFRYYSKIILLFGLLLFFFNTGYTLQKCILSTAITNLLIMEQFKLSETQSQVPIPNSHANNNSTI